MSFSQSVAAAAARHAEDSEATRQTEREEATGGEVLSLECAEHGDGSVLSAVSPGLIGVRLARSALSSPLTGRERLDSLWELSSSDAEGAKSPTRWGVLHGFVFVLVFFRAVLVGYTAVDSIWFQRGMPGVSKRGRIDIKVCVCAEGVFLRALLAMRLVTRETAPLAWCAFGCNRCEWHRFAACFLCLLRCRLTCTAGPSAGCTK